MLEEADVVFGLGFNQIFQSWMLLSLLQLPSRKRVDLLRDFQHGLPNTRQEHVQFQQAILRDRVLESSVFDLRGGGRNVPGARGQHLVGEEVLTCAWAIRRVGQPSQSR